MDNGLVFERNGQLRHDFKIDDFTFPSGFDTSKMTKKEAGDEPADEN